MIRIQLILPIRAIEGLEGSLIMVTQLSAALTQMRKLVQEMIKLQLTRILQIAAVLLTIQINSSLAKIAKKIKLLISLWSK